MDEQPDTIFDIPLPSSPSDASLSNLVSPTENDNTYDYSDLDLRIPSTILSNHGSQDNNGNNTVLNSQILNNSNKSNGKVYEINQNGKLKLKISLKGMKREDSQNTDINNDITNASAVINNNDNNNAQLLEPNNTANIEGSQSTVSSIPTLNNSQSIGQQKKQENSQQVQEKKNPVDDQTVKNASFSSTDDVFSDDINFSEIEENSINSKIISPTISLIKSPLSYSITIKFSPENKYKLHPENLNSLKSPSKRVKVNATRAAKAKLPPKPKLKRRPKLQYSRYMVKTTNGIPISNLNTILTGDDPANNNGTNANNNNGTNTNTNTNTNNNSADNNSNINDDDYDDDDDGLVEQSIRLSLRDPLSGLRMVTPLRTRFCSHVECFDYESFLAMYNLKPFKIAIKRYGPASPYVGQIDIMKLLEDTKRKVLDIKNHNSNTLSFPYKAKMRQLKDKGKQLNELEWFTCPICKLEFNIKKIGDVYVVGEFVDLLQDLTFEEDNEAVVDVEIDMSDKGKWRWIREAVETNNTNNGSAHQPSSPLSQDVLTSNTLNENLQSSIPTNTNTVTTNTRNNIEVVALDSDDEDDEDEVTIAPSEPTTSTIIDKIAPLIQASNPGVTEEEMMRQIDALFDAEVLGKVQPLATTTTNINILKNTNTNTNNNSIVNNNNSIFNSSGSFVIGQNGHQGVVGFRPGAFTVMTEDAPVFTSGDGGADDPIVLD